MSRPAPRSASTRLVALAAFAGAVAALYFAREVLIPLALAALLVFVLSPLVRRFESWGLSRVPAVILVAILSIAPIALTGWVASAEFVQIAAALPGYKENIARKIEAVRGDGSGVIDRASETIKELGDKATTKTPSASETPAPEPVKVTVVDHASDALDLVRAAAGPIVHPIATLCIVLVFVFFFLLQREDLRDRVIRLVSRGRITVTTQALDEMGVRISRYLRRQLLVNLINGVILGAGFFLIGIPNALLFGLLAAMLRFIPYAGPIIAASLVVAVSLAVGETWRMPLLTGGLFLADELIIANVIEPWIYGKGAGVSPVGLLVAMAFWTWLWGIPGLLLAAPMTVCLAVIGRYVPQMAFLNVMLGDEPVLEPHARLYQRLLAADYDEASNVVEAYLKDHTLVETFDDVLLPALRSAGEDEETGDLNEGRHQLVLQALRDLVEEADHRSAAQDRKHASKQPDANATSDDSGASPSPIPSLHRTLAIPARDESDAIAAQMLEVVLARAGQEARALSLDDLGSDLCEVIAHYKPDSLFISAVPPFASTRARVRYRAIRRKDADLRILVGLWTLRAETSKGKDRILATGAHAVVGTLSEALDRLGLTSSALPPSAAAPTAASAASSEPSRQTRSVPRAAMEDTPRPGRAPATP